jgi:hypothetical protein
VLLLQASTRKRGYIQTFEHSPQYLRFHKFMNSMGNHPVNIFKAGTAAQANSGNARAGNGYYTNLYK